jgi:hypothetical protein
MPIMSDGRVFSSMLCPFREQRHRGRAVLCIYAIGFYLEISFVIVPETETEEIALNVH